MSLMYGFKSRHPLLIFCFFTMGALTSKPYAFNARPWELVDRETYDYTDPTYVPLRVSFRGSSVMRVLPDLRSINTNEWISDRARFGYDSLDSPNRLFYSCFAVADAQRSFGFSATWFNSFFFFRSQLKANDQFFSLNLFSAYKFFSGCLGGFLSSSVFDFRSVSISNDDLYAFSSFFFVGSPIRFLSPSLAVSFRQLSASRSKVSFFTFGPSINNSLLEINLGNSFSRFLRVVRCGHRLSRIINSSLILTNTQVYQTLSPFNIFGNRLRLLPGKLFEKEGSEVPTFSLAGSKNAFNFVNCELSSYIGSTGFSTNTLYFPIPHPYEIIHSAIFDSKIVEFLATVHFPVHSLNIFGFNIFYYRSARLASFNFELPRAVRFQRLEPSFQLVNFFEHFTANLHLKNSLNIILNIKRQKDARSNYFYFLRYLSFARAYCSDVACSRLYNDI